ncbi:MAG: flagellar biosynthesis protein FlhA, partial [Clostridiales bacterium]|nr:flagellar biosynthesis protein FlhA [Clostridiales bacterium]
MKKENKELVEDVVPSVISIGDLQKVLCLLLLEQIPIRDLTSILEAIGEYGTTIKDTDLLTEYVRQALKRTITRKFTEGGKVKVIALSPDIENIIMGSLKKSEQGAYLSMDPVIMQKIVTAHMTEVNKAGGAVLSPIILTSPVVRLYYKRLIDQYTP